MFRKWLFFNLSVSRTAVTTVETSDAYQIMLMLILMMQACVVCVFACTHVLCKPVRAYVSVREFSFLSIVKFIAWSSVSGEKGVFFFPLTISTTTSGHVSCLNWYEAEITKLANITKLMESTTTCPCGLPMLSNESRWMFDWSRFVTKSGCHSVCFYDRQQLTQSTMVRLYSGLRSMSDTCNCCAKSTQEHTSRWRQEHYIKERRSLKLVMYNSWKTRETLIDNYYSYLFIK